MSINIEELLNKIIEHGAEVSLKVIGVLIALWVAFRIAAWLEAKTRSLLLGRGLDEALSIFFGSLIRWAMIASAILACLGVFGIETTSFAAIIGAAGLAVGLAFQGTLSNFAAGVMLLTFRPFKIGDYVDVGQSGSVAEIGLFTTALDTLDNRRIILPNSTVASGVIENLTKNAVRRVDIDVGVAYDADLDKTRAALDKAAASVPGRDPERGHQVFLGGLGDSAVNWQVRVWCKTEAYWDVWQETVRAVKQGLDGEKLTIPFPQMDVHLDRQAS